MLGNCKKYEVFYSEGSASSLTFSGAEIKSKESSRESGYGIRVQKDGRLGFSYCEKEDGLPKTAELAARISRFSPKTKFQFSPKSKYPRLRTQDPKLKTIEEKELKDILVQVRDGVERHAKKARVILSAGSEKIGLETSEGFRGEYDSTSMSVYAEGMKEDGFGFAYEESISMIDDFVAIGETAGRMAKEMSGAKKLKKGEYPVVFELTALDELLGILLPSFSGDWKRKKTSVLHDKIGKRMFDENLSIYDDPLSLASDARPFDDEGTRSRKRALIERGVVKNFIYDKETAALEGVRRSGFCSRAHYSALPGAGGSNLRVGNGSFTDLEKELKDPLVVHSLHGSHTANTTTGDFGLEVNVAFHKGRPVRGFLLSGNIFKLLKENVYIEKEAKMHGSLIAPRMALGNVQVVS